MSQQELAEGVPTNFVDRFTDDLAAGKVIGSTNEQGMRRNGVDRERIISIDNGGLRIAPLIAPGWGRASLAYGPYRRSNGLVMVVAGLNGHNTSQSEQIEVLWLRLVRWLLASQVDIFPRRLLRWAQNLGRPTNRRQILRWIRHSPRIHRRLQAGRLDENFALGWFRGPAPANPLAQGNAFIMHATGAENGELWARVGAALWPALRSVQNIPLYYVIVLRERGAAYYLASQHGVPGAAPFPDMRPVAIDTRTDDCHVYALLTQSMLGQVGFRVDTRVTAFHVAHCLKLATWYGTAHVADTLRGAGSLAATNCERGGTWHVTDGFFERCGEGTYPRGKENIALVASAQPSGLIHGLLDLSATCSAEAGLIWRASDPKNCWACLLGPAGFRVQVCCDGVWKTVAATAHSSCQGLSVAVQIVDDGKQIAFALDGRPVFAQPLCSNTHATAGGVGLISYGTGVAFRSLEAHPHTVPIPGNDRLGAPWEPSGTTVVAADDFTGAQGELAGRAATVGGGIWRKDVGCGTITVAHGTAHVVASAAKPNPGRLVYTLPWQSPAFADVTATILPPGKRRGSGEKGRAGLVFWQNSDNYIIINTWLDDVYDGTSISSFFYLGGYEDLYDAVWTNVGRRITWGIPYTLRVVCDGMRYTAFVNDEPVLHRQLSDVYPGIAPLQIRRIGLAANWEWGDDTGSSFHKFVART